jgi:hypothetical protein
VIFFNFHNFDILINVLTFCFLTAFYLCNLVQKKNRKSVIILSIILWGLSCLYIKKPQIITFSTKNWYIALSSWLKLEFYFFLWAHKLTYSIILLGNKIFKSWLAIKYVTNKIESRLFRLILFVRDLIREVYLSLKFAEIEFWEIKNIVYLWNKKKEKIKWKLFN